MGDLGQVSLYLVTGAMTAYLIAMIAFTIDLTRKAKAAPTRARVAVASGSGHSADEIVDEVVGTASDAVDNVVVPGPRKAAGIGMTTFTLGTALLLIGIVTRGLAAGRVPWANMYEFTLMAVFIASAVFLGIQRKRDVRYLGTFIGLFAVLALFLALAALYIDPDPVQPALQSYWLVIHVSVATASMGVLAVAAVTSTLQLVKDRAIGRGTVGRVLGSLPSVDDLERLAFRINAVGFVLWTFTLIAGAIWAEHAWGRFWGWDAKEVWTFVVWVIYAAYLHARSTRGWEGRRAAWFSVAGFVSILVNYYVVNLFFSSLHSYSGV